jgi:hypothetical protein
LADNHSMSAEPLLIAPDAPVTCPNCKQAFSLEQGFARQALESIAAASNASMTQVRTAERENTRKLLKQQSEDHERALAQVREMTAGASQSQLAALQEQLAASQVKLAAMDQRVHEAATARAAELVAAERQSYEQRLAEAQGEMKLLRDEQLQLRVERQKLKDEREAQALLVQRQVDARVAERETQVRTQEQERASLRELDLQKKLDDMVAQLAEAQRRSAQGSQQLQGEVLELALEEGLRREFALDVIEEVKKGVRGGDVIHRVVTRDGKHAGILLWETKRARDFSTPWIAKLKEDMRNSGAEVGLLVTMPTALPREWVSGQSFGLHDGVYIVVWSAALHLGQVLRAALLDVHKQRLVSAGKGEKMEAVYDYVTSPQFANKLRAVHEAMQRMREELESEKNQTQQRWARREKQLQVGVAALLGIGGEIQGLAQKPLGELELDPSDPG